MTLFWVKGYQATSLKDLEDALKMRPGSIYAAFQSKEALFRATLERYSHRIADELGQLVASAPSPLAALQAHLERLAELDPCDRPSTACMLVKSLLEIPQETELRAVVLEHLARVEDQLATVFQRARDRGELPPDADPSRLAQRIQTYIFGLKIQAQRRTDPVQMQLLCADLAEEIGRLGTGWSTRQATGDTLPRIGS
ncbi:TetR/AcrR family transcriptional regulator [Pseudooceanicola lipolyticus]|nr:TetR/AcrR family transcriptional regulator [Pseudooceanicola lipolyticus]